MTSYTDKFFQESFHQAKLNPGYQVLARDFYNQDGVRLKEKILLIPGISGRVDRIVHECRRLQEISPQVDSLGKKTIIDLGCGSMDNGDQSPLSKTFGLLGRFIGIDRPFGQFEPWFSRVAHLAGTKRTVGVDLCIKPEDEFFEAHNRDIMDFSGMIETFGVETFDGVNNVCFTVPEDSRCTQGGTSPLLQRSLGIEHSLTYLPEFKHVNERVNTLVRKLLKKDGTYLQAEKKFTKRTDGLYFVKNFL